LSDPNQRKEEFLDDFQKKYAQRKIERDTNFWRRIFLYKKLSGEALSGFPRERLKNCLQRVNICQNIQPFDISQPSQQVFPLSAAILDLFENFFPQNLRLTSFTVIQKKN
jgi:hypothetical protein